MWTAPKCPVPEVAVHAEEKYVEYVSAKNYVHNVKSYF